MKTLIRLFKFSAKLLGWFLLALWLYSLVACTPYRYTPVEIVQNTQQMGDRIRRDSVYIRDSIIVKEKNDTVFKDVIRYEYIYKFIKDTVFTHTRDSITNTVEVERKMTKLEKLRMDIGTGVLFAIPILIALWLLYRKFKK